MGSTFYMRIAVSGTHRSGKTTIVEELSRALPAYAVVDEPYYLLAEEGHDFAEMPCLEDFELQLERSIDSIVDSEEDTIFDRCPMDLLAYLLTHRESGRFDVDDWLSRVRSAMKRIDLVVFVPVEDPDRIALPDSEDAGLRRRVDEELREILLEDPWEVGMDVLEVTGTVGGRVRPVLAHVG